MAKQIHLFYQGASNQIIIQCDDGSLLFVTVGDKGASLSYSPDDAHYPEPMKIDDKGRERYPTEFTPF